MGLRAGREGGREGEDEGRGRRSVEVKFCVKYFPFLPLTGGKSLFPKYQVNVSAAL